eukprot:3933596-Rhodomonas_salina.1
MPQLRTVAVQRHPARLARRACLLEPVDVHRSHLRRQLAQLAVLLPRAQRHKLVRHARQPALRVLRPAGG